MTPGLKPHYLLDTVKEELKLKNDAELARLLGVTCSCISRTRNRLIPVGDTMLVALHCEDPERYPISRLKQMRDYRPALHTEAVAA